MIAAILSQSTPPKRIGSAAATAAGDDDKDERAMEGPRAKTARSTSMLKRWFAVRCHHAGPWVALLGVLAATPALAASPTKVTADWKGGVSGLPSDVSMYVYVPSKVATNPAVLVLVHYCGGSAPSVFGQ